MSRRDGPGEKLYFYTKGEKNAQSAEGGCKLRDRDALLVSDFANAKYHDSTLKTECAPCY